MRVALSLFAILDAILLWQCRAFLALPDMSHRYTLWRNFIEIIQPVFLISLVATTSLFLASIRWPKAQRFAFLVSYAQFPFRYVLLSFSFGFLVPLFRAPPDTSGFEFLMYVAMLLEVVRLIATTVLHVGSAEAKKVQTKLEVLTGKRRGPHVSAVAIQLVAAERLYGAAVNAKSRPEEPMHEPGSLATPSDPERSW